MSAAYEVVIPKRVAKAIRRLDAQVEQRILEALSGLAADPRRPGAIALQAATGVLRIRVGDYRVVYEVRDAERVVLVVDVGHRAEVYR